MVRRWEHCHSQKPVGFYVYCDHLPIPFSLRFLSGRGALLFFTISITRFSLSCNRQCWALILNVLASTGLNRGVPISKRAPLNF